MFDPEENLFFSNSKSNLSNSNYVSFPNPDISNFVLRKTNEKAWKSKCGNVQNTNDEKNTDDKSQNTNGEILKKKSLHYFHVKVFMVISFYINPFLNFRKGFILFYMKELFTNTSFLSSLLFFCQPDIRHSSFPCRSRLSESAQ